MKRSDFLITAVPGATVIAALPARAAVPREQSMQVPIAAYGSPSAFERSVVRLPRGVPTPGLTPLAQQLGIITPSGLTFTRVHAGIPALDPRRHRLIVHGLVAKPLTFSLADLMRFPSAERVHFLECSGNSARGSEILGTGVQFSHGLVSCCAWTGVPLGLVLEEAGIDARAKWLVVEGADGAAYDRSIPLAAIEDALLVYGQNGEMLRPEQGYPLRLLVPGFEGSANVKWVRRIKLVTGPVYSREETAQYTQPGPDGKIRLFDFVMDVKSVITSPSPGDRLRGGFTEGRGFAWSGRGKIASVEVSVDGGATWTHATLDPLVLAKSFTRFTFPLRFADAPLKIASRAKDETGAVQPTLDALVAARGPALRYHVNAIAAWHIGTDGSVTVA